MAITAAMVKELRERTGVGMMECKKALVKADGDMEAAAQLLRESGQAKADKKAGRVAAEGRIIVRHGDTAAIIIEVNCETDFVANDDNFIDFAESVAAVALEQRPADVDALMAATFADGMAVRMPVQEAFDIYSKGADRIIAVSDDAVADALRLYFTATHNVAEGAGAAPLAGQKQERDAMAGRKVGVNLSGGNIDTGWFAQVLACTPPQVS